MIAIHSLAELTLSVSLSVSVSVTVCLSVCLSVSLSLSLSRAHGNIIAQREIRQKNKGRRLDTLLKEMSFQSLSQWCLRFRMAETVWKVNPVEGPTCENDLWPNASDLERGILRMRVFADERRSLEGAYRWRSSERCIAVQCLWLHYCKAWKF